MNGDAFVAVEVTVENHTAQEQDVWVNVTMKRDCGRAGEAVSGTEGKPAAVGAVKVHLPASECVTARTMICVEDAAVWDIDSPDLYTVTAQLVDRRPTDQAEGMEILDSEETLFGIRTISVDAKNGFMLNGRSLKLKGGCIHHDNGILGAASLYESEYRKVKLHKDNGYNALRFAHNPMSADLMEACDRLGILVMDEAFDTWNMPKNRHDFCRHFQAEWQQEMKSFMVRDRKQAGDQQRRMGDDGRNLHGSADPDRHTALYLHQGRSFGGCGAAASEGIHQGNLHHVQEESVCMAVCGHYALL